MAYILSTKNCEGDYLKKQLQKCLENMKVSDNLIFDIKYSTQLQKNQYQQIINFFSDHQCFEKITKLQIIIEGKNNISLDEITQLQIFIQSFQKLQTFKLSTWQNCGLQGEQLSLLIRASNLIPSLQKLILNIERNDNILNSNEFSQQLMHATQLTELDVSNINLDYINEQQRVQMFKQISVLTQLQSLSFSFVFNSTEETIIEICQSLQKLTEVKKLGVRIIQLQPVGLNEFLYQSISLGMKQLQYLTLIFDNHYIHLPCQDQHFQKMINLTSLRVQIKSFSRTTNRQLNLLFICVAQVKNIVDLDLHVATSDYNFLTSDLSNLNKAINLKSIKLRIEIDHFYHEEQFLNLLQNLFEMENLKILEIQSNVCLLTKKPTFNSINPMILSLMYINGTDLIELFDNSQYFKSNKQLILNSILFKKYFQNILINNPNHVLFDLYFE